MATYPEYTGANLEYIYDRDNNSLLSDFFSHLNITPPAPSYGSRTSFKTKTTATRFRDNFMTVIPRGLNNVYAEMNVDYNNLNNSEAAFLIGKLETSLASTGASAQVVNIYNSGFDRFIYETYPTGISIYPTDISGLHIKNYSLQTKENGLNDLKIELVNSLLSSSLDYRGIFTRQSAIKTWATGENYSLHDIVYYPDIFEDKRNNIFYCISGHNGATSAQAPHSDYGIWTQSFYFQPDYAASFDQDHSQVIDDYSKGFVDRIKTDRNSNALKMNLKFEYRSNKETTALLHFLENKMGYRTFDMIISGAYKTKKAFRAPTWVHTPVFYDSNTIEMDVEEDVRGMFSKKLWSYAAENAELTTYVTNITNEGCQATDTTALAAADTFLTALKQTPTGFASPIIDHIYHLWCPLCDGTGGFHVALIANSGDAIMTKIGTNGGLDDYSLTGGFKFNGSGALQMGISETEFGVTNNSMGAYVLNSLPTNTTYWLGSNNSQNDFHLGCSTVVFVNRTFHKNSFSIGVSPSTGFIMGTQFVGWSNGRSSRLYQGTTQMQENNGFNLSHVSRSTHSYVYGGRAVGVSTADHYTQSTFGLMYWGKGITGQMQTDFANAVETFMAALGRMP